VNDCRVGVPPVQVHVAGTVLLVVLVVDVVVVIVIGMVIGRVGTVGTVWAEAPAARRTTGRTRMIAMVMTICRARGRSQSRCDARENHSDRGARTLITEYLESWRVL